MIALAALVVSFASFWISVKAQQHARELDFQDQKNALALTIRQLEFDNGKRARRISETIAAALNIADDWEAQEKEIEDRGEPVESQSSGLREDVARFTRELDNTNMSSDLRAARENLHDLRAQGAKHESRLKLRELMGNVQLLLAESKELDERVASLESFVRAGVQQFRPLRETGLGTTEDDLSAE